MLGISIFHGKDGTLGHYLPNRESGAANSSTSVHNEDSNPLVFATQAHEVSLEAKILKAIFERDWQKVQPTKENEASNVATPRQNEMSLEAKRLKATFEHGSQEVKRTAERETADGSTTSRLQPCVIPADENDA